jgi:hypothetical protein
MKVTITKLYLPVVLFGCETSSLILWEDIRLQAFKNGLLKNTFGLKTQEVTKDWKKTAYGGAP